MKRAKWSEIPKDYRRNYKKEAVEALKIIVCGLMLTAAFVFLVLALI